MVEADAGARDTAAAAGDRTGEASMGETHQAHIVALLHVLLMFYSLGLGPDGSFRRLAARLFLLLLHLLVTPQGAPVTAADGQGDRRCQAQRHQVEQRRLGDARPGHDAEGEHHAGRVRDDGHPEIGFVRRCTPCRGVSVVETQHQCHKHSRYDQIAQPEHGKLARSVRAGSWPWKHKFERAGDAARHRHHHIVAEHALTAKYPENIVRE
eukprot:ctg_687.g216